MLHQANHLRQVSFLIFSVQLVILKTLHWPIGLFLTSADEKYGPFTALRCDNRLVKHIPWSAFKLGDRDWLRVVDARDILRVSNQVYSHFSRLGLVPVTR